MALPAIATVTVLQFIQIWDDLLVGLLFIQNTAERPITVGLAVLAAGRTTSIPVLMAGSLCRRLPAMLVYLGFQRYLVKGLTMGIDRYKEQSRWPRSPSTGSPRSTPAA